MKACTQQHPYSEPFPPSDGAPEPGFQSWCSLSVVGLGGANFLSDLGQEIPTVVLPSILDVLGAPAAALGLIESAAGAALGAAKLIGGPVSDAPSIRRPLAVVSYALSGIFSALMGLGVTPWQVGASRIMALASRGLEVPARDALLADLVAPTAYGRAYGLKRAFDSLGGIIGLSIVLALLSRVHLRDALLMSAVPGLLAAGVVMLTVRPKHAAPRRHDSVDRRVLISRRMRRLFLPIALTQISIVAASLPILRATQTLALTLGPHEAARAAVALYTAYKIAGAAIAIPAGFAADRLGSKPVFIAGALLMAASNLIYIQPAPSVLIFGFVMAGLGMGCLETAQCTAIARAVPLTLRGSAFGILAASQNLGTVVASAITGLLWTLWSPGAAFVYLAAAMVLGIAASLILLPNDRTAG